MVRLKEESRVLSIGMTRESSWAVTKFGYDKNGNLIKVCMPEGGCYYYEYDRDDRLVKERHVENGGDIANEICYTYDAAGNQTSVTDVNGNTYRYEYDLRDREVAAIAPDGGKTRVVYDKNSNIISRYMPLQKERGWKYSYDSSNRMTEVITPEGKLLNRFTYEADGQLAGTMDEAGGGIRLTYDLAGRRIHALTMGGSSQSYRYDAMGNITGLIDGMSNTTGFILDSWGRITGVKKPDGTMVLFCKLDDAFNVTLNATILC